MSHTVICTQCQQVAQPLDWRCTACGGKLDFERLPAFSGDSINLTDTTLWRYQAWLGLEQRVTLGEGMTPLVATQVNGYDILAKCEYRNPTGSYKDRGTVTLVNHLAQYPIEEVIDDSSGNAGAALAAYASAAGIPSRIFVSENGSADKKALIQAFGGELVTIAGEQHEKRHACEAASASTTYASHAWSPYFLLGQITAGFELWEQTLPHFPDAVLIPVGHGALFVGIARAFQLLKQAKLIDKAPKMFAIQTDVMAPVVQAYETGQDHVRAVDETQMSLADGIMVNQPVHGDEVLAIIRQTEGAALRVSETAIRQARAALARRGFMVEPTSAVTVGALPQVMPSLASDARVICCLTGNGLKKIVI